MTVRALRLPRALALLLILALGSPRAAGAQAGGDPSPHSEARLVAEEASIRPGEPFTVALRLEMEAGWHSYWKNPGDSGQPTSIAWSLPEGFTAGPIAWPFPRRIETGPLTSYGYEDEVLLLTRITPPADLAPGAAVTLEAHAGWLICADLCLPAEARLHLVLPVRDGRPAAGPWREAVARARRSLPRDLPGWTVRATGSTGSYVLSVTAPEDRGASVEGVYFFPSEKAVLEHAAAQPVSKDGDVYHLALQQSEYARAPVERLRGVLVAPDGQAWHATDGVRALAVDVPVEAGGAATAPPPSSCPRC